MKYDLQFYPESQFGGYSDFDGTIHFYLRVNSLLRPDCLVLDIGCGRGQYQNDICEMRKSLRILKHKCKRVIGIDRDICGVGNPYLDEFRKIESHKWPLEDDCVDLAICDSVLEHLEEPELFFAEAKRVVKSGGYLCLRTPNALGYAAIAARLIPNRFHANVVGNIQSNRKVEDVFPTFYRCNTIWKVRQFLNRAGFTGCVYGYDSEPTYFEFSKVLYWLGVLHQKYSPQMFRLTIFAFTRKA